MKMLTIVPDINSGGVQRSAYNFVQGFVDRGQYTALLIQEEKEILIHRFRE